MLRIIESHEQIDEGGLTTSRRANESNPLPFLDIKGEVIDDDFVLRVTEDDFVRFKGIDGILNKLPSFSTSLGIWMALSILSNEEMA